jgi:hypothetical protein
MNRLYDKITDFMDSHGELDEETETYHLDIENGVVCFDLKTGSIKVEQTIRSELLSGETVYNHPIKTYYKDFETPYCLKSDLKELLKEIKK